MTVIVMARKGRQEDLFIGSKEGYGRIYSFIYSKRGRE